MTARTGTPGRGFRLRRMVNACRAMRRDLAGTAHSLTPIYDELAAEGTCTECPQWPIHDGDRCLQHIEPVRSQLR